MSKNKWFIFTGLLIATVAFAAGVKEDVFQIGKLGSSANKVIELGDTRKIRSNETDGVLEFTNDAVNWARLGSGSGGGTGVNLFAEDSSDFESGTPTNLFSGSTGAGVLTAETTDNLFGDQSAKYDALTASDTIFTAAKVIPNGMIGRTCALAFNYTYPSGVTGEIAIEVDRIVSAVTTLEFTVNLEPADTVRPFIQFFQCPDVAGAELVFRIKATADAQPVIIDDVFMGTGRGGYAGTEVLQQFMRGNNGSKTSAGDIINFNIIQEEGDTGLFEWSGNFITVLKDHFATITHEGNSDSGSSAVQIFRNNPGQTLLGQSNCANTTFDCITAYNGFFQAGDIIRFSTSGSTSAARFSYIATRQERSADETLTVETSGTYWEAFIRSTVSSDIFLPAGASSNENVATSSFEMVDVVGDVNITCDGTEQATADTCTGSEDLGVAFTPVLSGRHEICFHFQTKIIAAAAQGAFNLWQMDRVNSLNVPIERGLVTGSNGGYDSASGSSDYYNEIDMCNVFELSAGEQHQFKLSRTTAVINATPNSNRIIRVGENLNGQEKLMIIKIRNIDQQVPSPVFKDVQDSLRGKVVGSRDNVKHVSCKLDNGGTSPPTFSPTSSACADWIDSTQRSVAGNYIINFVSGFFSQAPDCVANVTASNGTVFDTSAQANTVNSIQILTKQSGVGLVDAGFTILCTGE